MTSNPTERKPPNSTSIGKRIRIAGVDREVFRGPRWGYFFMNSKGNRTVLTQRHREEVFLEAPAVDECTTSATGKRIRIAGVDREVFRGYRGGYFYINCKGTRIDLFRQHREELGLEAPVVNECTTSANGTSTGKHIKIAGVNREVFQGRHGGYFYMNCKGNRTSLLPQHREKLGLEAPAVYECTTSANGTSTGKRIKIAGVDREVFRGYRGAYFYINCKGTRIDLIRQQREKLGLTKKG